jgi:hypothetical protein
MVHDFEYDHGPFGTLMDDRIEKPPEGWQVLYEEIGGPVLVPKEPWEG